MIIKVDTREKDLFSLLQEKNTAIINLEINHKKKSSKIELGTCLVPLFEEVDLQNNENNENDNDNVSNNNFKYNLVSETLLIGDIVFCNNDNENIIIFERKTLYDLASSIKDGRYNEQSFRLNQESLHNHNIYYIIEGDFSKYNESKGRIPKKTLYSCLFTLSYYKGFSVLKTNNIFETSEIILNFADKYSKETTIDKKTPFYSNIISLNEDNYTEVVKSTKEKNEYITQDNIGSIMLSCIPTVSSKISNQIMEIYKNIKSLIKELENNPNCLNNLQIQNSKGSRKINKSTVDNIKKFLHI